MPIASPSAGDRILNTDLGAFYSLLKGVAGSGEAITLVYNAAGVIAFIPSSDPSATTQLFQIKNAASTVKSALTAGGGALFSSRVDFAQGSTIASAGTTDLSTATGNYVQISGTTTITSFGTVQAGSIMVLEFQGILTITHNASSLILRSGANATTAAGDIYIFVSEALGTWREISHLTGVSAALPDSDPTLQTNYHHFTVDPINVGPPNTVAVGSGTSVAYAAGRGWQFSTGATNPSSISCNITMVPSGTGGAGDLISKIRRIEFQAYIGDTLANANAYIYLTDENVNTVPSGTVRHFGIKNLNGTVSFTTADGTTEQTTNITSFVTAATQHSFVVTFDGTTATLFIDGTSRATHATNVPAAGGTPSLKLFINNNSTTNSRVLSFMMAEVLLKNS